MASLAGHVERHKNHHSSVCRPISRQLTHQLVDEHVYCAGSDCPHWHIRLCASDLRMAYWGGYEPGARGIRHHWVSDFRDHHHHCCIVLLENETSWKKSFQVPRGEIRQNRTFQRCHPE